MQTFNKARRSHTTLARAADENAADAAALWNAITGGEAAAVEPIYAAAVRDTVPLEQAALLSTDDVAAAYAFELLWRAEQRLGSSAGAFEHRDLARRLWASFSERASRTSDVAHGLGWDLAAAWSQVRDVEVARGDLAFVERVAKLAGRMYVALRGELARRVAGVPEEVFSVTQGSDVSRLLPSEAVVLGEPLLEDVLLERLASGRAATYAVRGPTPATRGPLVIGVDESSSMEGSRNAWAKASTIALTRVALKERRPVSVVHFSTSAVVTRLQNTVDSDVIRHFLGGGTAIGIALTSATDEVAALAARGRDGADIILVTDGVDRDEAAHARGMDEAARRGARVWTIAIECDVPAYSPLRSRAAGFCRLGATEMNTPESVLHMLTAL